jgi:hypothetical protein
MNGFKLTGVGAGTARTDAATIANLQDGTGTYVAIVGGTGNAITLSPSPAIAAYATGQRFQFIVASANTGAATVAISGLAAKDIHSEQGLNLVNSDLYAGKLAEIVYDGTRFLLMGGGEQSQRTGKLLTSCFLNSCVVTSDPTTDLGVASKQYVDALWTTGDVKITLKTTADSGWVMFDDGTIGSASSGATTRANADTEDLFTLLWTNTTDSNCAVSGGRSGSAAADFAANKTIALPKLLGRELAVAGAGSGLTSRALAQALGSEDAIVVSHDHNITDTGHSHTEFGVQDTAGTTHISLRADGTPQASSTTTSTSTTGITVSTSGSSGTGANMPPTTFLNVMVKL